MHDSQLIVQAVAAYLLADPASLEASTTETWNDFSATLMSRVSESPDAQYALEALMRKPDSRGRQAFCREELNKLDLGGDDQLIDAARELTRQLRHGVQLSAQEKGYQISGESVKDSVVVGYRDRVESTIMGDIKGDDREEQQEQEAEEAE